MDVQRLVLEFGDEYGPMIFDMLMAFPLVRLYRRFQAHYCDRAIAIKNKPSLLQLPDEMILEICGWVKLVACASSRTRAGQCRGCASSRWALRNFSKSNKRLRNLTAPLLLEAANVGQGHGWWRASHALTAVENSLHVNYCTRTFKLHVYAGPGKGANPPKRFLRRVALILPAMQKLKNLVLIIPEFQTEAFRRAFENSTLQLPTIQTLVLSPHTEWIIPMCPNVRIVSTNSYPWLHSIVGGNYRHRHSFDLVRAAGRAAKLHHFEMSAWWNQRLLWAIRKAMPDIESLAMPGGRYDDGIAALLPILAHFRSLKTLVLAGAGDLHVDFDPPRCGNAYMGSGGDALRRSVAEYGRQAEQRVAEMVFGRLKGLKELWLGNCSKAMVLRDVVGSDDEIFWSYEWRQVVNSRC